MLGRFVEKEEIWSFTPFIDLSLYRWVRRNLRQPRIDRQILMLFLIALMEIGPRLDRACCFRTASLRCSADQLWLQALVWLSAPIMWALRSRCGTRCAWRCRSKSRNVCCSKPVSTPCSARSIRTFSSTRSTPLPRWCAASPNWRATMTVKLANILRALLKDHDAFVPLREELKFTDDYLDIEVVRFGADKLRVEKEIDPRTLEVLVPSILLQPLIENSIKHGLEPRIHGGTVTLRSRLEGDRVLHRSGRRRRGHGRPASLGAAPHRRRHRHEKRAGAARSALRQPGALQCGQQSRPRDVGLD